MSCVGSSACWSRTGARSPSGSSGLARSWGSRRSPSTPKRTRSRCTGTRRTRRTLSARGRAPSRRISTSRGSSSIAKRHEVDAIHPGYGFLSENADFARRCEEAGIVFIGPDLGAPGRMFGDKVAARRLARGGGPSPRPGDRGAGRRRWRRRCAFARSIGLPAAWSRRSRAAAAAACASCAAEAELESALERARSEAETAFGNPAVFLEQYIEDPKHIEVQILGRPPRQRGPPVRAGLLGAAAPPEGGRDRAGARASARRSAQEICEAAARLMRARRLRERRRPSSSCTTATGNFYFIEVNPRIQVEHTVTELITGVDIVQAQIRIAEGYAARTIPRSACRSQEAVTRSGYAIQCRVTTEDPENHFLPDTGRIIAYRCAGGLRHPPRRGQRAFGGAVITPFYDSLLVKVHHVRD